MALDDKEKGSEKKAGGSRKKTLAKKRAGEKQSEESSKRQKIEDDADKIKLRMDPGNAYSHAGMKTYPLT
ncbi:hypothetical protein Tco_0934991 [Tanacetum coccineum]